MNLLRRGSGVLVLLTIVLTWQAVVVLGFVSQQELSSPSQIMMAAIEQFSDGDLASDLLATARRVAVGFLLAAAFGVPAGFVLGRSALLHAAFEPIIEFLRPMPVIAVLPIAVLVLGLGDRMIWAVIAFASGWIVLLHTMDGVRSVDPLLIETGRVFHVYPMRQFFTIVLPAAAPHIFTGLRVAFGIAVIVAVVVELVAGFGGGLGNFIGISRGALLIPDVYAGIVLVAIVGYLMGQALAAVEHRLMAWHRGFKAQARQGSSVR
jgi:ABC-type nitrate/sulfonate/bicarbonate transport system permease component